MRLYGSFANVSMMTRLYAARTSGSGAIAGGKIRSVTEGRDTRALAKLPRRRKDSRSGLNFIAGLQWRHATFTTFDRCGTESPTL